MKYHSSIFIIFTPYFTFLTQSNLGQYRMHTSISSSLRTKRKEYRCPNLAIRALNAGCAVWRILLWVGKPTTGKTYDSSESGLQPAGSVFLPKPQEGAYEYLNRK